MYQRDVNEIKAFVKWRGPDALVNTGLFVLLTIQAGLSTVRGSMVKVERDFYQADCLWGKKARNVTGHVCPVFITMVDDKSSVSFHVPSLLFFSPTMLAM